MERGATAADLVGVRTPARFVRGCGRRWRLRLEEKEAGVRGGSIYGGEGRRDAWRRGQEEAGGGTEATVMASWLGTPSQARDERRGLAGLGRGLAGAGTAQSGKEFFFQRTKIIKANI